MADEIYYEADAETLRGDTGPCDHFECDLRATHKTLITLGGVHITAYTCVEHTLMLVDGVPVAA